MPWRIILYHFVLEKHHPLPSTPLLSFPLLKREASEKEERKSRHLSSRMKNRMQESNGNAASTVISWHEFVVSSYVIVVLSSGEKTPASIKTCRKM
jgi:aromatic ring-opening dioxygenase LigB subunit